MLKVHIAKATSIFLKKNLNFAFSSEKPLDDLGILHYKKCSWMFNSFQYEIYN